MRKQRGFSLIELLIVLVILLIIVAIAVPNLIRNKVRADFEVIFGKSAPEVQKDCTDELKRDVEAQIKKMEDQAAGNSPVAKKRLDQAKYDAKIVCDID